MFKVNEYKEQRERLRNRFLADKTGDQAYLDTQAKLLMPILDSQRQIHDKLTENQAATSSALVPFVNELQRQNNLLEDSQSLPYYHEPLEIENVLHSTPKKDITEVIDLDQKLNTTDRENLEDMELKLPSEVYKDKVFEETLKKVNSEVHRIGARLGKTAKIKPAQSEKQILESQKETLKKYKDLLKYAHRATERFLKTGTGTGTGIPVCRKKMARGRPRNYYNPIIYHTADDLL